ncbi:dephospho-CoA kinase [Naumannella halotolerans]|uniref:Dephospho-CoA kinase n=1 Tax=Naumannella halotolerans TaxID=993414 RepID=A0A4R7J641_9ACTN|nr:dephospho-CoA kinase [Naumannella halotolerans]TDT32830.1 dephospho-CoA kinase [Naumannella halotolerans]
MTTVGLTGGIASGKSAVADLLAERGAVIVDADRLAREVVEPGSAGLAAVVERFGPQVLAGDGSLDRKALGAIVFDDSSARGDLEQILHPRIRELSAARAAEAFATDPDAVVVQVIPLLVETGQADRFDLVLVVDVEPQVQLQRLRDRDGLDLQQARARIAAQATRGERLAAADVVIDNSGDRTDLCKQVDSVWERLRTPTCDL